MRRFAKLMLIAGLHQEVDVFDALHVKSLVIGGQTFCPEPAASALIVILDKPKQSLANMEASIYSNRTTDEYSTRVLETEENGRPLLIAFFPQIGPDNYDVVGPFPKQTVEVFPSSMRVIDFR